MDFLYCTITCSPLSALHSFLLSFGFLFYTYTLDLCTFVLSLPHILLDCDPRLLGELLWHQNEAWINWMCGETVMFAACSIDSQSPHDQCAVLFHPGRWHHRANVFNKWTFFSISHQEFKSQLAVMEVIESFLTNRSLEDVLTCRFSLICLGVYKLIFERKMRSMRHNLRKVMKNILESNRVAFDERYSCGFRRLQHLTLNHYGLGSFHCTFSNNL